MTTLAVLQPSYLPWLGYFDQMIRADVFVYYDDVQFDKHGWRNRNRIKGATGPVWLTVPVRHKGRSAQPINSVEIVAEQLWAAKHIRTLKEAYARAPFTETYIDGLADVLSAAEGNLCDLCCDAMDYLRAQLNITTPVYKSSALGIEGDQTARLVNLCKHFDATAYLTGNAAKDYLETDLFDAHGIEVVWQDYDHPVYKQLHGDFVSHLSIVDLLMNEGPDSRSIVSGN